MYIHKKEDLFMIVSKIQKWGNSQGIRIPKHILESINWSENEEILITTKDNQIIIKKLNKEKRKNIKELFKNYKGNYEKIDVDFRKSRRERNMVKQGDIVKVNFNPQKGHEQAGYRPALVISNNSFNKITKLCILCPITNTKNKFPLHIELDSRTITTGAILCEHIKTLDLEARDFKFIEKVPEDILASAINIVFAEIEES